MILKISDKERVSIFGFVLTSVWILFTLVGAAAAIALIIFQSRPATDNHNDYMVYGYAGVLLATCIMLMVTCDIFWEYISNNNLDGSIEEIMEKLCYSFGGFRIVFYTILLTISLLFIDHGITQILCGTCLELACAAFWIFHEIRRMKTTFIEAYIVYHIFILIMIILLIVVFITPPQTWAWNGLFGHVQF